MRHVFILVNQIDLLDSKEVSEVTTHLQNVLEPFHLDSNGAFDHALYAQRVFNVAARNALKARITNPTDEQLLVSSGIVPFEQSLGYILKNERAAAIRESRSQALNRIKSEVEQQLSTLPNALRFGNSAADLEHRRLQALRVALREVLAELAH